MRVNWKVRIKNKTFWITIVPAFLLVVQAVASLFGYDWDFVILNQQITAVINAVFALLAILGVVNDPTTVGITDSNRAMNYDKPNDDTKEGVG